MAAPNQLQFIRRVLYQLKQRYGARVEYYRPGDIVVDEILGSATSTKVKYNISKVVRLPGKAMRSAFSLPGNMPDANYDDDEREFIFRAKDLPSGFTPEVEDYLITDGQRYDVKKVTELDFRLGYLLVGRLIEGVMLERIHDVSASSTLELSDGVNTD